MSQLYDGITISTRFMNCNRGWFIWFGQRCKLLILFLLLQIQAFYYLIENTIHRLQFKEPYCCSKSLHSKDNLIIPPITYPYLGHGFYPSSQWFTEAELRLRLDLHLIMFCQIFI